MSNTASVVIRRVGLASVVVAAFTLSGLAQEPPDEIPLETLEDAWAAAQDLNSRNPLNDGGPGVDPTGINQPDEWKQPPGRRGYKAKLMPPGPGGFCQILLSPSGYQGDFPDAGGALAPWDSPFVKGVITVDLFHEMLHKCLGTRDQTDCEADEHSCEHLAIAFTATQAACERVKALCAEMDALPPDADDEKRDLQDEIIGICASIEKERERWNNDEGREKANECLAGGGACPFDNPNDCPVELPTPPGGAPAFTDNNIIPACADCNCGL